MGCAMSSAMAKKRLRHLHSIGANNNNNSNDAVSLCRERKRLVKKAVKQRQAFADAHFRYLQSLTSISSAISIFIARYSSPPSQFLITFAAAPQSDSPASAISEDESESRVCQDFHDDGGEFKWDFFNLVDERNPSEEKGVKRCLDGVTGEEEEQRNGRELLEALKDVEDHFLRACEFGLDVSRMLEVDKITTPHPSFEDSKETSTRKRSISSRSSSCKSLLSASSRSTSSTWAESVGDRKSLLSSSSDACSTWTENRSDHLDGRWGMVSGSHSFTLGRLYAWEKKLYHEVKAGEQTRKNYKHKYSQLRPKDMEGDDLCPSKATSEVKDLYHLMLVALQRAESISKQIEKLRDEELQPQLLELLHGLMRTWKSMSETHEIQKKIMREIKSFSRPESGKFCSNSHRLATLQLEAVIQNWQCCFLEYSSTQKAYVKSLSGWLSKFIDAEAEYYYNGNSSLPPIRFNGPTLILTCHNWLTSLERLPDKSVIYAMKRLGKDVQALCDQQGVEQQQKQKVDELEKERDRKILTFEKAEDKSLFVKHTAKNSNVKEQNESLDEKKKQLDMLQKKLEFERERYRSSVLETEQATINRLQMGFFSVFESLAEFSRASVKVYADLVTFSQSQDA